MSVSRACSPHDSQISRLLLLFDGDDPQARSELLSFARSRLHALAHVLIRANPVRRWEESDDLIQQTMLRLDRSLRSTPVDDSRSFFNLAALEMRHALIDFGRHYFGPCGSGAKHASDPGLFSPRSSGGDRLADSASDFPGSRLHAWERWERLYRAIDELAEEEREVVNLLSLLEMTQVEVAALLGVATKTVARRWRRARLQLAAMLAGDF